MKSFLYDVYTCSIEICCFWQYYYLRCIVCGQGGEKPWKVDNVSSKIRSGWYT